MSSILGAVFAILVGMLSLPSLMSWQHYAKSNINAVLIAQAAREFNDAAQKYIDVNSVTLQATATASVPVTVSVADLQTAGFLSSAFSASNAMEQTWQLEVLQPSPGDLQALAITTGGTSLSDSQAIRIAKLIGTSGGFFPKNDTGRYPGLFELQGTAWGPLSSASYTVQPGHIASLLFLNDSPERDRRLYRDAVPGKPELNTMNTPLVMNSVQIDGVACSKVGAIARDEDGDLLACRETNGSAAWVQASASLYWADPVHDYSSLPSNGNFVGSVRVTVDTGRAYQWTGFGWDPLAVDQWGNLRVPATLRAANERVILAPEGISLIGENGAKVSVQNIWADTWISRGSQHIEITPGGRFIANGPIAAKEFMPSETHTPGASCNSGKISKDAKGIPLLCRWGAWKPIYPDLDWDNCRMVSGLADGQGTISASAACEPNEVMVSHAVAGSGYWDCRDDSTVNSTGLAACQPDTNSTSFTDISAHVRVSAKCCPRM